MNNRLRTSVALYLLFFFSFFFLILYALIHCLHQEAEKEVDILSRYKKQLQNTNSRLETELEETKKHLASRDQVSYVYEHKIRLPPRGCTTLF